MAKKRHVDTTLGSPSKRRKQSAAVATAKKHAPSDLNLPSFNTKKRKHSSAVAEASSSSSFKVFCDLDGVLTNFDAGIRAICNNKGPDDVDLKRMWQAVSRTRDFYAQLPWMRDGRELWDCIRHLKPDILTGVPMNKESRRQKAAWCRRELDHEINHVDMAGEERAHCIVKGRRQENAINVITCWSRNKHFESGPNAVLIDDRQDLAEKWEAKGGLFIHHTSTRDTLRKLKEHGILQADDGVPQRMIKKERKMSKLRRHHHLHVMPKNLFTTCLKTLRELSRGAS